VKGLKGLLSINRRSEGSGNVTGWKYKNPEFNESKYTA